MVQLHAICGRPCPVVEWLERPVVWHVRPREPGSETRLGLMPMKCLNLWLIESAQRNDIAVW